MSAVSARHAPASLERLRQMFDARWASTDGSSTLRRAALEEFMAAGWPTPRNEDWKYTNLRRLESREFSLAPQQDAVLAVALDALGEPTGAASSDPAPQPLSWIAQAGTRIVLVNGHWAPRLSSPGAQPPGVTVLTLAQWQQHDPAAVAAFLAESQGSAGEQAAKYAQDAVRDQGAQIVAFNSRQAELLQQPPSALERLNLAFFEDGVVIHLADDTRLDEPVYVVHQWNAAAAQRMNHPRVIVRAGRNSHCTLIEHFLGPDEAEYFTNAVTTADLAEGATLTHYRLQLESLKSFHIGHIQARLQAHSRYACHDIALGASLGRMNLRTELHGAGAHAALHGLFVPMGTQHLDTHTRIDHIAAHTTSEEDYRGVAAGRGRGVFNGKVIVHPGAQKIDARQSSRNLLLSPGAEIDTKPELEIYADDVKCSHGATTGQLDATALFYLRSRGLSETQARSLLIRAFAESILSTIEHAPLRSHLERHLDRLFAVSHEARP